MCSQVSRFVRQIKMWQRAVNSRVRHYLTQRSAYNRRFSSGNSLLDTNCGNGSTECVQRCVLLFGLCTGIVFMVWIIIFQEVQIPTFQLFQTTAAVMSISTLDNIADVNFHIYQNNTDSWNQIIWEMDGSTTFIEKFSEDLRELGRYKQLPAAKSLISENAGNGFWIFSFGSTNQTDYFPKSHSTVSSIRAYKIMDHVARHTRTPLEELEVAVAVRAFIAGGVGVSLNVKYYEDSSFKEFASESFHKTTFSKGLCFQILKVPFNKRIDEIRIQPEPTKYLKSEGLVVIDKVVVVVTKQGGSESLIYSMVPTNWC